MEKIPEKEQSVSAQIGAIDAQITMVSFNITKLENSKERGIIQLTDYKTVRENYSKQMDELLKKRAALLGEKPNPIPEGYH